MGRICIVILSMVVVVGLLVSTGLAVPIMDQSLIPGATISLKSGIGGGLEKAQTFTTGSDGLLTHFAVMVNRLDRPVDGDLVVQVRSTTVNVPDEHAFLFQSIVPSENVPIGGDSFSTIDYFWLLFDARISNIWVEQGDVLSIVLKSSGIDEWVDYRWAAYTNNPYSGGLQYYHDFLGGVATWTPGRQNVYGTNMDTCFMTFIDPDPSLVPIPAAIILLGSGLIGLAGCRKYSKKRQMT